MSEKLTQQTAELFLKELELTRHEMRAAIDTVKELTLIQHDFIKLLNRGNKPLTAAEESKIRVTIKKNFAHCNMLLESISKHSKSLDQFKSTHLN